MGFEHCDKGFLVQVVWRAGRVLLKFRDSFTSAFFSAYNPIKKYVVPSGSFSLFYSLFSCLAETAGLSTGFFFVMTDKKWHQITTHIRVNCVHFVGLVFLPLVLVPAARRTVNKMATNSRGQHHTCNPMLPFFVAFCAVDILNKRSFWRMTWKSRECFHLAFM